MTGRNGVTAAVNFDPVWAPRIAPDPRADITDLRRQAQEARRLEDAWVRELERQGHRIHKLVDQINAQFSSTSPAPIPSSNKPHYRWSWFDDFIMTAMALGASEPTWDGRTRCFWANREHYPLAWVKSIFDVRKISIPQWQDEPAYQRMIESRQRWSEVFPENPPRALAGATLKLPAGREPVKTASYMSFIDMGPSLIGATEFMTILADGGTFAEVLMEKFFELSTSYADFLQSRHGERPNGLHGFGGDYTCMMSPQLYEKYSAAWDVRLFEHFRNRYGAADEAPCNLHSCGPSAHLYSDWGRHPLCKNIATIQTRLLPGHVKELRHDLPDTLLQLTFHPQHFDFACVEPEDVRRTLVTAAEDAEFRDVHFDVFAIAQKPGDMERLEENLQVLCEEMDGINHGIGHNLASASS